MAESEGECIQNAHSVLECLVGTYWVQSLKTHVSQNQTTSQDSLTPFLVSMLVD